MTDRSIAATLAKGLEVLGCFVTGADGLPMPEIVRRTGFDRATVRQLCLTLVQCGYLQTAGTGFRLAPRVLALAGGYLATVQAGRLIQPVLRHAAEELAMEVALATRDRLQALYVARAAPASARVTLGLSVGSCLNLLHTAVGRMLLARSAPKIIVAALARMPQIPYTEATQMDPARVLAAINEARGQGYCVARNEFELGAVGVAVPVGAQGATPFVLVTPLIRFDDPGVLHLTLDVLRKGALSIGRIRGVTRF